MIRKVNSSGETEAQNYNSTHLNGMQLSINWIAEKHTYETIGLAKTEITCLLAQPHTVNVQFFFPEHQSMVTANLTGFESIYPVESGEIIPFYNCHGFCFLEGKFWLNDDQATKLIEDEYTDAVTIDKCEIIGFLDSKSGVYKHTCKYDTKTQIISHKLGIRKEAEVANLAKVEEHYPGLKPVFLKLKAVSV